MGDFRPISLQGSMYKIIPKVLAARMKGVRGKIISHIQDAFVEDRQTLDCSLIADEAIDSKLKQGGMYDV